MQTNAAQALPLSQEFAAPALAAEHNWAHDRQSTDYKLPLDMFNHAELSQDNFKNFYTELRNSIDPNIRIDDSNLLKSFDSMLRKMNDPSVNYDPRNIGDPLRVSFIIPKGCRSLDTLISAMNIVGAHPQCTSFKNEYVEPNPQSHFSAFKAHVEVDGPDGRPITCELQIHHEGMLRANKLTATLSKSARSMEQASRDMADTFRSNEKSYRKHMENLSLARDFVDKIKRLIHDSARINSDLIGLIPSHQRSHYMVDGVDLGTPPKYARTFMAGLPDAFIKRVNNKKLALTSESVVNDFKLT